MWSSDVSQIQVVSKSTGEKNTIDCRKKGELLECCRETSHEERIQKNSEIVKMREEIVELTQKSPQQIIVL